MHFEEKAATANKIVLPQLTPDDIRDSVHNLVPGNKESEDIYDEKLRIFVGNNEGVHRRSYDDGNGNITVGIGFNMSRGKNGEKSRYEWNKAFADFKDKKPDFDAIKYFPKKHYLTTEQINCLFKYSITVRRKELMQPNNYGKIWPQLRLNERMAIEDAFFNSPKLVQKGTKFHAAMMEYYETDDRQHLAEAVKQIKDSTKMPNNGIRNRRNAQATMLDSTKCPYYSKPHEPLLTEKPITALLDYTIIPLGAEA